MRGLDSAAILGIEMLEPGQGSGDQKAEEGGVKAGGGRKRARRAGRKV